MSILISFSSVERVALVAHGAYAVVAHADAGTMAPDQRPPRASECVSWIGILRDTALCLDERWQCQEALRALESA